MDLLSLRLVGAIGTMIKARRLILIIGGPP